MVHVIINKHDKNNWSVNLAGYYQGTPLMGRRLETFPSLKKAEQFTKDINAIVMKVDR